MHYRLQASSKSHTCIKSTQVRYNKNIDRINLLHISLNLKQNDEKGHIPMHNLNMNYLTSGLQKKQN